MRRSLLLGLGRQKVPRSLGFGHQRVAGGHQGWGGSNHVPPCPPRVSLLPPATTLERVLLALSSFYATFIQDFS